MLKKILVGAVIVITSLISSAQQQKVPTEPFEDNLPVVCHSTELLFKKSTEHFKEEPTVVWEDPRYGRLVLMVSAENTVSLFLVSNKNPEISCVVSVGGNFKMRFSNSI